MTEGSSHDDTPDDQSGSLGPGEADLSEADELDDEGMLPGLASSITLASSDLKGALEALILVSDKPVAAMRLARLTRQDLVLVKSAIAELVEQYRGRGISLDEIAGGYQFRTAARYAPFVRSLTEQKPVRLSRTQLEVLSIIAYRQPVTRPEIDDVRGVDSGHALKVLLEREVIKIIGKRDDVGRPMLYGTTNEFLELFGLKSLRDLPTLKEFAELTPESRDMYERRIGEPLPAQGEGMNLETHYEKAERADEHDDDEHDDEQAVDAEVEDVQASEGDVNERGPAQAGDEAGRDAGAQDDDGAGRDEAAREEAVPDVASEEAGRDDASDER